MTRSAQPLEEEFPFLSTLTAHGAGAPSFDEKLEMVHLVRGRTRDRNGNLDRLLVDRIHALAAGLGEARATQAQLKALLEELTLPPWFPAILEELLPGASAMRAVVMHNGSTRIVGLADDVDAAELRSGDEVYLGNQLNVIVGRSPAGPPCYGETARFDRYIDDGRMVVKARDEELVLRGGGRLQEVELVAGDQVRWHRGTWLGLERIATAAGTQYLLSEAPQVTRAQVGGHEAKLEALLATLTATLVAPEAAARYGLGTRSSTLLWGPPGVGKTLMARVAAAELSRVSGRRCRIAVVKPAEWESPWVGETQMNIRNCFAAATREAEAAGGFTILFLDEIEAIGRLRGSGAGHHSDKFLAALLAELDGFGERSKVAVIAATNRKDLVDPALLERLSDTEIEVRRPDRRAARSIFGIHLDPAFRYSPNGSSAAATRDEIIETAVSRFYSPNADNDLCVLRLRDGTRRTIAARELASGRIFEQVCRAAGGRAFLREQREGETGLRVADIEEAVADVFERLTTTLSPRNAHAYVADLPQDVDVVSVERVERKVKRPQLYVNRA